MTDERFNEMMIGFVAFFAAFALGMTAVVCWLDGRETSGWIAFGFSAGFGLNCLAAAIRARAARQPKGEQ